LLCNTGEQRAFRLRLDYTERLAIDEQQVIAASGLERNFTQRNTARGGRIELRIVLYHPAAGDKLRINFLAGLLFGRHGGRYSLSR
jgi:hypothetical protein